MPYLAIRDYGIVGNLRTSALVGRNGSIDWCCFPYLSSSSVFGAILDDAKAGRFRVSSPGGPLGAQEFIEGTNVLVTRFNQGQGTLVVTDFMPLRGDINGREAESEARPALCRIVQAENGPVEMELEWSPRFDYARALTRMSRVPEGWHASGGGEHLVLRGLPEGAEVEEGEHGPTLRARLHLEAGRRVILDCGWSQDGRPSALYDPLAALAETVDVWRRWVHKERAGDRAWAGPWRHLMIRSELTLKLLTQAGTGAIAAAPTTSLPEEIGGVRNWDYRYAWIRDSSLVAQALMAGGHPTEASDFLHWIEDVSMSGERDGRVQIMYGLHGEAALHEFALDHLEGYRGSRPVNIGNGAYDQLQLDTYGEILDSAYELARFGEEIPPVLRRFLPKMADRALASLDRKDHGIWEIRGEARHYVYSKGLLWVALDRAVQLAERFGLDGNVDRWHKGRSYIKEQILEQGYDPKLNSLVQAYGRRELDASNLLLPVHELLPFDDPRVQGTIDATMRELMQNGLVYRYRAEDSLPGEEGAFALCTFWLVDALSLSGRIDEAAEIFESMAARANHVGLFPEEYDPASGEFLGNFPQGLTHIGFVNSLQYLAKARGWETPVEQPIGMPEHREVADRG
ncbi:glycoside hydrolase family 15 protein [Ectothiorhodospiraceae bacterium 2226]|nr:glycoside hydrolase family 15 protein [Ectothiorhodospiraceae bacterium 2226]